MKLAFLERKADDTKPPATRPPYLFLGVRALLWIVALVVAVQVSVPVVIVVGVIMVVVEVLLSVYGQLNQPAEPLIKEAQSPVVRSDERFTRQTTDRGDPPTEPIEVIEVVETTEFDDHDEEPDNEFEPYDERAHWLSLVGRLMRLPLVMLLITGCFSTMMSAVAGRPEVITGAVVVAVIALLVAYGTLKKKEWSKFKYTMGFIVLIAVIVAALSREEVASLIIFGLVLATIIFTLRVWIRWYYTRYVLTEKRFSLDFSPPKILPMNDSHPGIRVKSIESVESSQPWLMRMCNLRCGTLTLDTAGTEDEMFHKMGLLRDFRRLERAIHALIDDEDHE